MLNKRLSLPRRTVLRGMGAAVALPFLEAMVPAFAGRAAAKPVKRFGIVYLPNGIVVKDLIPPRTGKDFEITPILRPLEQYREHLTIVSGLANVQGDPLETGTGPHSRTSGCWLSGVRATRTEGADLGAGRTADQFAADVLGRDTLLRSLELALEPNFTVGGCEGGYSCAYINTFSWASPDRPLPMETNPAVVFERLFGDGGTGAALAHLERQRSILDELTNALARLQRMIGVNDRRTMDEYLDAVRNVERRIQQTRSREADVAGDLEKPYGIPTLFEDHAKLMMELMVLAFRTDMTRVIAFQLARELSLRSYPEIGVPEAHHDISHYGKDPAKIAGKSKIDQYHMLLLSHLVERMASTPDGNGSLLDNSILLFGGGMGDGDRHSPHNLPVVLAGSGSGTLQTGRHVRAPFDVPFMNLCLSLLDKFDVHLDSLGVAPISLAAATGNPAVVERLLKSGANPNAALTGGETALMTAARAGHLEAAEALIDAGSSLWDETPQGMGLTTLAIGNANYDVAALLIDKGADVHAAGVGWSPLHQVVRTRTLNIGQFPVPQPKGRLTGVDIAKMLLARGAEIDARTTKPWQDVYRSGFGLNATPFLLAAKGGDVQMMSLLAANGADVTATNANGTNAIMAAAGIEMANANEDSGTDADSLAALTLALELGAGEMNAVDRNGDTALHGAVFRQTTNNVQLLAASGATLDVKNKRGAMAIDDARDGIPGANTARSSPRPETAKVLHALMLERGLNPADPTVDKRRYRFGVTIEN